MKKTLSLILALVLVLTILVSCGGGNVGDNKETPIDDFEFEAGDGGFVVTKYNGNAKKIVIPSIVENKKVTSLNRDVFGGNIVLLKRLLCPSI